MLGLALRNITRHKARTALTLTAIVSGVVGLILCGGFVEDSLVQLREFTIHTQLGHLQIYRKGYYAHGSRTPYKYMIDRPEQVIATAKSLPQVEDVLSRLSFAGIINNGRTDFAVLGEGIESEKEARLGNLMQVVAGKTLKANDRYGIFLGEGVASATKLKPGDRATVLLNTAEGALNSVEFEVVGIFRSFSKDYDGRAVRINLPAAQELMASPSVNSVVLSLRRTEDTDSVAATLAAQLDTTQYEIKTWRELADFYDKTAALYQRQFTVLQVIILFAVLLSVVNSVNMSVFERTGEFGTLMALGTKGKTIFALVVLENALLGLLGSGVGALVGILLARLISEIGIPMPPPPNSNSGYTATIRLEPLAVWGSFAIGFFAMFCASLLPGRRAARLQVVEALRQN